MRSGWIPIALSFLVVCSPCLAQGADEVEVTSPAQRAETHSRLGVEYYQGGLYKEAVREMMLAYEAVPDATLLYNVARIYQKMEQGDLAVGFFKRFVAHEGADPDTVKDALGHMEALTSPLSDSRQRPTPVENIEELPAAEPPVSTAPAEVSASVSPALRLEAIPVAVAGAGFASMAITGALAIARKESARDLDVPWEDRSLALGQAEDLAVVSDISLGIGVAASVASVIALIAQRQRFGPPKKAAVFFVPAGPAVGPGLTLFGRLGGSGGAR